MKKESVLAAAVATTNPVMFFLKKKKEGSVKVGALLHNARTANNKKVLLFNLFATQESFVLPLP